MIILVPVVFVASGITQQNWIIAFLFALSVAVGLTPELLPMVVTLFKKIYINKYNSLI